MSISVGLLHPGRMGLMVASTLAATGHRVHWCSAGRSTATRARAESIGLVETASLDELATLCSTVVSVCPPEFAEPLARAVVDAGFAGLYLDANAISPDRARRLADLLAASGGAYVDGGIIGGPTTEAGRTWLMLSGPQAAQAAALFAAGPLETEVLGDDQTRASALKMVYASYSKGSAALLISAMATAAELGVLDDLRRQWELDGKSTGDTDRQVGRSAAKAWRWAAEMREISSTFGSAGLPPGFHAAAADLYDRLAGFRDREDLEIGDVLREAANPR